MGNIARASYPTLSISAADSSCPRAYKSLSPKARMGVGVGVIAWGVIGLHLSDQAEEKFGYTPSEKDKEELWKWTPKVTTVDKSDSN